MNLEQQLNTLNKTRPSTGKKIANLILGRVGDNDINMISDATIKKTGKPASGNLVRGGIGLAKAVVSPK